jgi:hypothetical protein
VDSVLPADPEAPSRAFGHDNPPSPRAATAQQAAPWRAGAMIMHVVADDDTDIRPGD